MPIFGSKIRALREALGKSMRDLASFIGTSVPYVSDVERNRRNPPSGEKLEKVATFLNVDRQDLKELIRIDRGYVELDLKGESTPVSNAALALARHWPSITDEEAIQLLEMLTKWRAKNDQ